MEILLNELSLTAQFDSVEDFIDIGIKKALSALKELSPEDIIYKKYDFFINNVTPTLSIHDVLTGTQTRHFDEIRRFKTYLSKFFEDPYWEANPRHNSTINYIHKGVSVLGTSLAEACERDKVIFSFFHKDFSENNLSILKSVEEIIIDNVFEQGLLIQIKLKRGIIKNFSLSDSTRFNRTSLIRQGKPVYNEISTGYFWYLDNLHKNHFEVFDSNEKHIGIADMNGNIDRAEQISDRKL